MQKKPSTEGYSIIIYFYRLPSLEPSEIKIKNKRGRRKPELNI